MGYIVDQVEPSDLLARQKVDCVRLLFCKHRDKHIGAGHLFPARSLNMQDRPLDHALES